MCLYRVFVDIDRFPIWRAVFLVNKMDIEGEAGDYEKDG